MQFIRLNYLYRDYSNYKKNSSTLFSNPNGVAIEEIELQLRKQLLDNTWFLHAQWNLPDLHFENTDWEQDHPYHEFENLEIAQATTEISISTIEEFLRLIKKSNYSAP